MLCAFSIILCIAFIVLYIKPWYDTGEISFICDDEPKAIGCDSKVHAKTLVVVLHAFRKEQSSYDGVVRIIKSHPDFEDAEFIRPNLPFKLMSLAPPESIADAVMSKIDERWEEKKYDKILFIGHSMGALFTRKLLVLANGASCVANKENEGQQVEEPPVEAKCKHSEARPWAKHIDKIILLAGMNNGWSISHHMGVSTAIKLQIGDWIGDTIEKIRDKTPVIMHIKNGSKFISDLRFDWVAMKWKMKKETKLHTKTKLGDPVVVQLLGTQDDLVPPTDNIDPVSFKDFSYLEVGHSNHSNVIEMALPVTNGETTSGDYTISYCENLSKIEFSDKDPKAQQLRACVLLKALSHEKIDYEETAKNKKITDVVFVIHGIRDLGFWTEKIAKRIKDKGRESDKEFLTFNSSYGYFPMLSFLRPNAREQKVQWFVDEYTRARAQHPDARFHFVGHSHGTYLFARALEKYDAIKFNNVVFAGSVVKQDYDWGSKFANKNVSQVLNFTATFDWVVAWFPNAIEALDWQDLGSAGHDGFTSLSPNLYQVENIIGDHGAALDERNWNAIANFILLSNNSNTHILSDENCNIECKIKVPNALKGDEKRWWFTLSARLAFLIWLLIAAMLFFFYRFILRMNVKEWQKTTYVIALSYCVWLIITRL